LVLDMTLDGRKCMEHISSRSASGAGLPVIGLARRGALKRIGHPASVPRRKQPGSHADRCVSLEVLGKKRPALQESER
jgi:hypothetical protein